MFNPPRPKIDKEIITKAAKVFIKDNIGSLPDDIAAEDLVGHLVKHFADYKNGFELAKDLEWEGWDIDAETVQVLDDFGNYVTKSLHQAEKEWIEQNNIQPPFPENTEVEYMYGRVLRKGVITGIYPHRAGMYEIRENGHNDQEHGKCRIILKWENVKEKR